VISAAENSNEFQKTRFWKEKAVEDVVTLGPMAQATLVNIILSASDFKCFTLIFPLRGFKTQPELKWIFKKKRFLQLAMNS
jgi:hypothetical protein